MEHPIFKLCGADAPILMGILNCTPDSFSDGGSFLDSAKAFEHADTLISSGAHIVDIGGESTGPGRGVVPEEEEIRRIRDSVAYLASKTIVSVDTYKAGVAEHCLSLGARIINDVSALRADPEMGAVVRAHNAFVVLMYSKQDGTKPHADTSPMEYRDVLQTIRTFLSERIDAALGYGIPEHRIILDPGMGGFVSPNRKYSWELLSRLSELREAFSNFPFVVGTSRKGFLNARPESQDYLSQLTSVFAVEQGVDIVRTHNIALAESFFTTWQKCQTGSDKDEQKNG